MILISPPHLGHLSGSTSYTHFISAAQFMRNLRRKAASGAGIWKPIPPDMREYFRSIPAGCKYVFYRQDKKGNFHKLGEFKNAWISCLEKAGITNFRFHDTRHCSASALIDNGTPEQIVMSVAGWKTNMLRVYYHREPKRTLDMVCFSRKCDNEV